MDNHELTLEELRELSSEGSGISGIHIWVQDYNLDVPIAAVTDVYDGKVVALWSGDERPGEHDYHESTYGTKWVAYLYDPSEDATANEQGERYVTPPLSIAQLRDIHEEPIWIQTADGGWWDILEYCESPGRSTPVLHTAYEACLLLDEMGTKWSAYRHKPAF